MEDVITDYEEEQEPCVYNPDCSLCCGEGVYDVEDSQGNIRLVICPPCYRYLTE